MVTALQSEPNNEDAKSTSSTLVNGEHCARNEADAERTTVPTAEESRSNLNLPQIRHGFDQEMYEEDIIRFLYFSEKRHDSNAQPNATVRNALKDWVK